MVLLPTRQFTKQNKTSIGSDLSECSAEKRGNRLRATVEVCFLPKTGEFSGQQQMRV